MDPLLSSYSFPSYAPATNDDSFEVEVLSDDCEYSQPSTTLPPLFDDLTLDEIDSTLHSQKRQRSEISCSSSESSSPEISSYDDFSRIYTLWLELEGALPPTKPACIPEEFWSQLTDKCQSINAVDIAKHTSTTIRIPNKFDLFYYILGNYGIQHAMNWSSNASLEKERVKWWNKSKILNPIISTLHPGHNHFNEMIERSLTITPTLSGLLKAAADPQAARKILLAILTKTIDLCLPTTSKQSFYQLGTKHQEFLLTMPVQKALELATQTILNQSSSTDPVTADKSDSKEITPKNRLEPFFAKIPPSSSDSQNTITNQPSTSSTTLETTSTIKIIKKQLPRLKLSSTHPFTSKQATRIIAFRQITTGKIPETFYSIMNPETITELRNLERQGYLVSNFRIRKGRENIPYLTFDANLQYVIVCTLAYLSPEAILKNLDNEEFVLTTKRIKTLQKWWTDNSLFKNLRSEIARPNRETKHVELPLFVSSFTRLQELTSQQTAKVLNAVWEKLVPLKPYESEQSCSTAIWVRYPLPESSPIEKFRVLFQKAFEEVMENIDKILSELESSV